MNEKTTEIKKKIKKELDNRRYQHTLGVAYTASSMAMRYEADIEKAFLAGILHDCAKNIPVPKQYELCRKYGIELSEVEKRSPALVHSKLGAYLAAHRYGIKDSDIINAIKYHTTGRPGMGLYEKILFVADYIEPYRDAAPNLEKVRYQAFTDLDGCIRTILADTLEYLEGKKAEVDPMTRVTYDYYMTQV